MSDQDYEKTWSIQVKTNRKPVGNWLLSKDYKELSAPTHIYLFVNLRADARPDFYVVPSKVVRALGNDDARAKRGLYLAFIFPQRC